MKDTQTKKNLLAAVILILMFLFSGYGKNQVATEKIPEPTAQQKAGNTIEKTQEIDESDSVPLPQEEDIVRLFFDLINEKKIPEAVAMLDVSVVPNESVKQAWGVQLNIFSLIAVKSIDPSNIEESADQKTYKVVLDTKIKPGSKKAAIPNYGWENGENIRWINLKKNSEGMWKIFGIGTGP